MTVKRNQGFTLIELVMTMLLLGTLSIVAIPYILNLSAAKAKAAAHKLVSDLSYARQLARSRNTIHGVSFDATANTYTVFSFDPITSTETPVTNPLTRQQMIIDFAQEHGLIGVDIQAPSFGGTTKVRFPPMGIPQSGDGTVLATAGSVQLSYSGESRTVFIQPNTGEVSYQ